MPTAKITAATDTSAPATPKRAQRSVARKLRRILRTIERSPGVPQRANDARAADAPAWRAGLVTAAGIAPEFTPKAWVLTVKGSAWPLSADTLARSDVMAHIAALLTAHCTRSVPRAAKRRARTMLDEFAREAAREIYQSKEKTR